MTTATLACPQTLPDGTHCQGQLHLSKDGPWIEALCPLCGWEASRHVDSTGPVREMDAETDNDETTRWWDR